MGKHTDSFNSGAEVEIETEIENTEDDELALGIKLRKARMLRPGNVKDWGSRGPSAAELSDIEERAAGRKLRAAFYPMIGDAPVLFAGDHNGAMAYLSGIARAIARGGWTKSEWTRLTKLHLKWWRRANGLDPYFEVYGNRRQWADHGSTYKNREDQQVVEGVRRVKAVIWDAVQEQLSRMPENATPAERKAMMEEVEAYRANKLAERFGTDADVDAGNNG